MGEKEKEIRINYETIFEILRREKTRDELQKLDDSFFEDTVNYLNEKKRILEEQKTRLDNFFARNEQEKIEKQAGNVKKLLKEFYDRREKKIIFMAMNASRLQVNLIDTSALLKEEKIMFDYFVEALDKFRKDIMQNVLEGRMPSIAEIANKEEIQQKKEIAEITISSTDNDTKTVKFLKPVSKFIGEELEIYGPFDEQETATLPKSIADVLISKGHAVEFDDG